MHFSYYCTVNTTQQLPIAKLLTTRETLIIFSVWALITFFVVMVYPWSAFLSSWTITIPAGWIMYHISFRWLYPKALIFRFPLLFYAFNTLLYCGVVFFITVISFAMNVDDEEFFIALAGISFFTLLLVLAPIQWFMFKKMAKTNEELFVLKKALGQKEANMDLLRSQINPHFLFNALNTLYGMAIHEKAERTSDAIEKLGSMMRFMLQENIQEKISLVRDLEYLNNYIALQRLRTDINPNIKIQISVPQEISPNIWIAPMLLIPFIENAYKHGISLREESLIRVSLEVQQTTLYFDVFNTKHIRSEHDPEKHNNGIGLTNVKQRLQLVYPGKHELIIRETTHDYYVHLVINFA
ncbi:MAG: histidine kinase [Cyclobacteriaceae bacterium]|nr:histidine kinase [Cyclobacteriaceae bacterium]